MLSTVEEQSFVIGDVMKSIDEMYSSKEIISASKGDNSQPRKQTKKRNQDMY